MDGFEEVGKKLQVRTEDEGCEWMNWRASDSSTVTETATTQSLISRYGEGNPNPNSEE